MMRPQNGCLRNNPRFAAALKSAVLFFSRHATLFEAVEHPALSRMEANVSSASDSGIAFHIANIPDSPAALWKYGHEWALTTWLAVDPALAVRTDPPTAGMERRRSRCTGATSKMSQVSVY
eukprot:SAG31_NODE_759_length_12288_cov_5.890475_5_plen_121_part_00